MINDYDEISFAYGDAIIDELQIQRSKIYLSTKEFIRINEELSNILINYMDSFMPEGVKSIVFNNQNSAYSLSQLDLDALLDNLKIVPAIWFSCRELLGRIEKKQYILCDDMQQVFDEKSSLHILINEMHEAVSYVKQILNNYSSFIIEQSAEKAIDAYTSIGVDVFEENSQSLYWQDARICFMRDLHKAEEQYDNLTKYIASLDIG